MTSSMTHRNALSNSDNVRIYAR